MQTKRVIDLGEARTSPAAKVFAGRQRGKYWREHFKLDELDTVSESVRILIPEDIISLNISFFLNLFGDSIRRLGKEKFIIHYRFESDPILQPLIDQGIDQALKRSSALPESE
jgi:hypothetical protein